MTRKRINKQQRSHTTDIIEFGISFLWISWFCLAWCILSILHSFAMDFDFKWLFNDMIWFDSCYRYSRRSFLSISTVNWRMKRIDTNETRNAIILKRFNNETVNAVVRAFVMNVFCFIQFCTQRSTNWMMECICVWAVCSWCSSRK